VKCRVPLGIVTYAIRDRIVRQSERVQPRSSAVDMTLPASAAARRRPPSISISCPQGAQQQTR